MYFSYQRSLYRFLERQCLRSHALAMKRYPRYLDRVYNKTTYLLYFLPLNAPSFDVEGPDEEQFGQEVMGLESRDAAP